MLSLCTSGATSGVFSGPAYPTISQLADQHDEDPGKYPVPKKLPSGIVIGRYDASLRTEARRLRVNGIGFEGPGDLYESWLCEASEGFRRNASEFNVADPGLGGRSHNQLASTAVCQLSPAQCRGLGNQARAFGARLRLHSKDDLPQSEYRVDQWNRQQIKLLRGAENQVRGGADNDLVALRNVRL